MKRKLSIFSICVLIFFGSVQKSHAQDERPLHLDSLYSLMVHMNEDTSAFLRLKNNYVFIRTLVSSLKNTEGSYHKSFDTLKAVSIISPEDDRFRIFTWHVKLEKATYRHFGCLQLKNSELALIPFMDQSDSLSAIEDTILGTRNWYGTTYYDVLKVKKGRNSYYTLLGIDLHEPFSTRRLIDVLWFDKKGEIRFGAPIFETADGFKHRRAFEYKKRVVMTLEYSEEAKGIVFDHLIPTEERYQGMYFNYVPDGSYDLYKWKKGKWLLSENIVPGKN